MKLRTTALALALVLALSLLSACGGGSGSQQTDASAPSASLPAAQPDADTAPDASAPDASLPGEDAPEESGPDSSSQSQPTTEPAAVLTLNKSDFTLFKVGDSYRLRFTMEPDCDCLPEFSSSDPAVATVSEDGTVVAVAPGTAVITLEYGGLTATCTVRCKFEADLPASGSASAPDASAGDASSASPSGVDLSAFYTALTGSYEFPAFMALADAEIADNLFAGLSAVDTQQCLVYANMMSMNMGELVLVQVTDSKDVDTVKSILQSRVDYMVDGGAWYPEPTALWEGSSRVVSNGCYVMMVVNADCESIVRDFDALFQ